LIKFGTKSGLFIKLFFKKNRKNEREK